MGCHQPLTMMTLTRINLGMGSDNKRRRYIVTSSLIGWSHTIMIHALDIKYYTWNYLKAQKHWREHAKLITLYPAAYLLMPGTASCYDIRKHKDDQALISTMYGTGTSMVVNADSCACKEPNSRRVGVLVRCSLVRNLNLAIACLQCWIPST